MLTAGIITEYNPFHNGHRYQIEQTRSELNCSHIISVMSGNFLQRGLPAVCNKFMRAEMAVASGVDAVLSFRLSMQQQVQGILLMRGSTF